MATVPNTHECTMPSLHPPGQEPNPRSIRSSTTAIVTYLSTAGQIYNPGPGYAGAILSPAAYQSLIQAFPGVNGPHVPPPRPPAQPVIPAGATQHQIAEANRMHRDQTEKHQHFLETLAKAKAAFLQSADNEFFEELHVEGLGYATVTLRQLIGEAAIAAIEQCNEMYANFAKSNDTVEQRLKALEAQTKPGGRRGANIHYCHSCGLGFHNGGRCSTKKEGHKEEATGTNRMGGSTKIHKDLLKIVGDF